MAKRAKTEYYVNNKELLEAMTVYRERVIYASEHKKTKPRVPNYIGDCLIRTQPIYDKNQNFLKKQYVKKRIVMVLRIAFNT